MMKVDAESAGILVAIGFFVMGFVSVPIAKGFLVGAFFLGIGVAAVLWLIRKRRDSRPVGTRIFDLEKRPDTKARCPRF
ncbi:MAG: hypothetical protein WCC04_16750 [Terriglobales bacterium]